jgi:hypothetical protein
MTDITSCAIFILLGLLFYAAISRGLFMATEFARQALIDTAGSLLDSDKISEDEKECISLSLDNAHSAWAAWRLAFLAVEVAVKCVFSSGENEAETAPPHLRGSFDMFLRQWIIATLGNSPLAAFLFATVTVLGAAVSIPINGFIRALANKGRHHVHA